ncbi:MAG: hypothetical protein AB7E60_12655 [Sphingobium sp.]
MRAGYPEGWGIARHIFTQDEAEYAQLRQQALEKEKKKYPGKMAAYRSELSIYQTLKKSTKYAKEPQKPVEPTEENFRFTPFEQLAGAMIGPDNRFAKEGNGQSTYVQAITPGSYRIYGPINVYVGGEQGGTCYCMGSVRFSVQAGVVTDLGAFVRGKGEIPDLVLEPASPDMATDPRLAEWTVKPADYRAAGKLPNYFGGIVGRINPIDGVIGYDRDRIIDLHPMAVAAPPQTAPDGQ